MDLNAVSIFVRVVEAGSFVGAARAAGIPKSTIARRIDELEAHLGVRLLQRSTRKSELTEAGRSFYERSRQIVDDVEDAVASVTERQREPRGKLRITASALLGETYVGKWCTEYMETHPHVELDMFLSTRKVDLLADGFDLAFRVGRLESSSYIVRRLAPAPSYLCASPAYVEARGTPSATDDLRAHECIVYSPDRVRKPWELQNQEGDTVSISVAGRLVVNSHPVALHACVAGLGLADLPALVCCEAIRAGALVRLLPEWSNRSRQLHALYPSRQHLAATIRTFLDFMTDKLTPAPWLLRD
jgi:DNA-binding transcriptional LysR family regulator